MKHLLTAFFIGSLFLSPSSGRAEKQGLFLAPGLGRTTTQLTNPDGTTATLFGPAFTGRLGYNFALSDDFTGQVNASYQYRDLTNAANSGVQKEFANQSGPGLGLGVSYSFFFLGADYFLIDAKHRSVGGISRELELRVQSLSYSAGASVDFNVFQIEFGYSAGQAVIGKNQTGLSSDSNYSDSSFWIQFKVFPGDKAVTTGRREMPH